MTCKCLVSRQFHTFNIVKMSRQCNPTKYKSTCRDRSISHRNSPPTVVYPEVRDLHEKTKDLHDEVRTLRQYMMDLERANNARVQSLEKARDRSEDEIRTLQKARDRAEDEIRNLRSIVGDSEKARLRAEDEVLSFWILVDAIVI